MHREFRVGQKLLPTFAYWLVSCIFQAAADSIHVPHPRQLPQDLTSGKTQSLQFLYIYPSKDRQLWSEEGCRESHSLLHSFLLTDTAFLASISRYVTMCSSVEKLEAGQTRWWWSCYNWLSFCPQWCICTGMPSISPSGLQPSSGLGSSM